MLSTAVMLYGMSLVYGETGSTLLSGINSYVSAPGRETTPLFAVAIFLTLGGFAFKVSAVPFHFWTPDTYQGAPTPVTAFLSVASKAGGFVAMLSIVAFGFFQSPDSWQPTLWILAAASMIYGNLVALRQTNIVRMLAYSSIAQGGFILVPLAVAGDNQAADRLVRSGRDLHPHLRCDEPRRLRRGDRGRAPHALRRRSSRTQGSDRPHPGLAVAMSMFMLSLAGIPPLAGWFAKFVMFRAVFSANTPSAIVLGVIAAVASVIAFFYYAAVVRRMWFHDPIPEYAGTTPNARDSLRADRRDRPHRCGRGRHRHLPAVLRPRRRARLHLISHSLTASRDTRLAAVRSWRAAPLASPPRRVAVGSWARTPSATASRPWIRDA